MQLFRSSFLYLFLATTLRVRPTRLFVTFAFSTPPTRPLRRSTPRTFSGSLVKSSFHLDMSSNDTKDASSSLPALKPTAKRLFLVRHGEVINPGGDRPVYYGGADVPLSDLGKQEAIAAAYFLQHYQLDHIFSSPLSRAVYGAEQVVKRQRNNLSIEIVDGFRELDRGSWYGKTKDEIGDLMQRYDACDPEVTPDGGEYYPDFKARVLRARDHEALARMRPGQVACLVSHLQVTRSFLSDALDIPTDKMAGIKVATASITCIDYDGTLAQAVRFQSYKPEVGLAKAKDEAN